MTTGQDQMLPEGFGELESFVADWALAREAERMSKRCSSDMDSIRHFYDVMISHIDAALDHLDKFDLDAMPERERRLFYLTLSLVEVGNAVEFYGRPNSIYALPADRIVPTEP